MAEFLEKCGYDPISIIKFEQDWNVDLNGDGKIGKSRRRRRRRDEDYDGKRKLKSFQRSFFIYKAQKSESKSRNRLKHFQPAKLQIKSDKIEKADPN